MLTIFGIVALCAMSIMEYLRWKETKHPLVLFSCGFEFGLVIGLVVFVIAGGANR
jgi:hypothetical protein